MLNSRPHHHSSTPPAGVNNACSGTGPKFAKQVVRSLSHTLAHIATVPNTPSHARAEKITHTYTHPRQLDFSFVSTQSTGRPQGDWHISKTQPHTQTDIVPLTITSMVEQAMAIWLRSRTAVILSVEERSAVGLSLCCLKRGGGGDAGSRAESWLQEGGSSRMERGAHKERLKCLVAAAGPTK